MKQSGLFLMTPMRSHLAHVGRLYLSDVYSFVMEKFVINRTTGRNIPFLPSHMKVSKARLASAESCHRTEISRTWKAVTKFGGNISFISYFSPPPSPSPSSSRPSSTQHSNLPTRQYGQIVLWGPKDYFTQHTSSFSHSSL